MTVLMLALAMSVQIKDDRSSRTDLDLYQTLNAQVGRTAEDHINLALWCEAHGLNSERITHLSRAIGLDPSHPVARSLLGMVNEGGRWRSPDKLGEPTPHDKLLSEYEARREATPATATAQWKLATWCEQHDLKPQAEAHATATIRLDPDHSLARKRLGYEKAQGRWLSSEHIRAEALLRERQAQKDRIWGPRLSRWRKLLREPGDHLSIEREIAEVEDPLAVNSIVKVFATNDPSDQSRMVQLLGQIDSGDASRMLAIAAIQGANVEVRRAAAETLIRRDPRDFVTQVINSLQDPVKYEVQAVNGPDAPGVLLIDGPNAILRRRYIPPSLPETTKRMIQERQNRVITGNDIRILNNMTGGARTGATASYEELNAVRDQVIATDRAEVTRGAYAMQRQLELDVARIEAHNALVAEYNDRAMTVLTACTNGDFGPNRLQWTRWWTDRLGYAFVSPPSSTRKPIIDQNIDINFQTQFARLSHACFAAGTSVRTRTGLQAIETLQVGDEVLTQDVESGGLTFEPVVTVFHNPPTATLAISFDDEVIVATGIHRFWLVGKGWTMARDLKPGDLVRTLGSTSRVKSVTAKPVQPVFNLEVSRSGTFFVGDRGVLVHDNSLVEMTSQPFDSPRLQTAAVPPANTADEILLTR